MYAALVPPHSHTSIHKEVIERMKASIGIDIGKRKCDYCVVDGRGVVVERGQYPNTIPDARECVRRLAEKYRKKGSCGAACETTANMWRITYEAFEEAGVGIKMANTFGMAVINKTGKKTDKVDAQKIANVLRVGMIPECYVPSKKVRGIRNMVRHHVRLGPRQDARDQPNPRHS